MRRHLLALASVVTAAALVVFLQSAPPQPPPRTSCPALAASDGRIPIAGGLYAELSYQQSEGPVLFVEIFDGRRRVYLESFDGVENARASVVPATGDGARDLLVQMDGRACVIRCGLDNLPGKVLEAEGLATLEYPGRFTFSAMRFTCDGRTLVSQTSDWRWDGREFVRGDRMAHL